MIPIPIRLVPWLLFMAVYAVIAVALVMPLRIIAILVLGWSYVWELAGVAVGAVTDAIEIGMDGISQDLNEWGRGIRPDEE